MTVVSDNGKWRVDTNKYALFYKNDDGTEEPYYYNSKGMRLHFGYAANHPDPDALKCLVNSEHPNEILDKIEDDLYDAVYRQIEHWKESDKDYIAAHLSGDITKEAKQLRMLKLMAEDALIPMFMYQCDY